MNSRRRAIMGISKSRLPSEYQEVEYLESTGEQYIDTGINLTNNSTIKCKFEVLETPTSTNDAIYGVGETVGGYNTFFVLLMRNPIAARVGTSSNQATSTNVQLNTIYDTILSNGTYIENGTTYTFTASTSFSLTNTCYVMYRNQSASFTPIVAKLYPFEIVGEFKGIPCYRKVDNKPGMYDLVTDAFCINANTSATQDFIVGPDV